METNITLPTDKLSDDSETVGFETLYPALIEIFGIIAIGYISGRFKLFTDEQTSGIGKFLGTFALPMMIFGSLCKVDLNTVNWLFWLAILLTKCIIFFIVLIVHAFANWGKPIGGSALYGIFVTQSNDFALGLPILNALFLKSHPEYPDYLFLLAPISLAVINPIGLILMEISNRRKNYKTQTDENSSSTNSIDDSTSTKSISIVCECDDKNEVAKEIQDERKISKSAMEVVRRMSRSASRISNPDNNYATSHNSNSDTPMWKTVQSIGCGIFFNPIIFFTISGLIFGTFVFGGEMPAALDDFVTTLGNSFASLALFSLGLAMVGKMERFKESSNLILPLMLVLVKTVLMPIVAFGTTTLLNPGNTANETAEWADFAFIYGTFPTAPTVYVFAAKYEIAPDMIASAMVVCTIISAPLTFVSAQLLAAKSLDMSEYETALNNLVLGISIASLVGVLWTIFIFIRTPNRLRYLPHSQTLILFIFQAMASTGGLLDVVVEQPVIDETWYKYLFYLIIMVGQYGTIINTALLAVAIYMITSCNTKFVLKISFLLNLVGITAPCILCGIILAVKRQEIFKDGIGDFPIFSFDNEYYITIALLILCSLTTMVSMIISERKYKKNRASIDEIQDHLTQKKSEMDEKLARILPEMEESWKNPENLADCNACGWENKEIVCRFKVGSYHLYHHNCQIIRHTVLLICLTFCMLVGLGFCIVSLVMDPGSKDELDATYIGMVFLDTVFVGGKGVIMFAVFGLEYETVIKPFFKWCKTIKSLYSDPAQETEDDPRLYHWTLLLVSKLFNNMKPNIIIIKT